MIPATTQAWLGIAVSSIGSRGWNDFDYLNQSTFGTWRIGRSYSDRSKFGVSWYGGSWFGRSWWGVT